MSSNFSFEEILEILSMDLSTGVLASRVHEVKHMLTSIFLSYADGRYALRLL